MKNDRALQIQAAWKRMRRHTSLSVLITVLAFPLFWAEAVGATTIINGGFEQGFTGWQTIGNPSIVTADFGIAPPEGTSQALIPNRPGGVPPAAMASFLGIDPEPLDALAGPEGAFPGSAIRQSFTGNAGDVLTFRWKFLTNEFPGAEPFRDFAFASLVGPSNFDVQLIANTLSGGFDQAPPNTFEEEFFRTTPHPGFGTFALILPGSGTFTLGIGVLNAADEEGASGLLVDVVRVSAIPEPCTFVLVAIGASCLTGYEWGRRRRRSSSS